MVTAAHVVEGAVQVDGRPYTGSVVGYDPAVDLAVLHINQKAFGASLRFADLDPAPGTKVAALGYPNGAALRMTEGTVVAVGGSVDVEGHHREDLLEFDADSQPGNSGGPVIDSDGRVVGVLIAGNPAGRAFAIPTSIVRENVADLDSMPTPPPVRCATTPLGPDDGAGAQLPTEDLTTAVASTLAHYFTGVNSGDFELAYSQFSARMRNNIPFHAFADGVSTSYDFGFDVVDADLHEHYSLLWLRFVSLQRSDKGPDGESCTQWSLIYELTRTPEGRFAIDGVSPADATSGHTPRA